MTSGRARVVAVIQARMGSTRLPGKVLLPVMGVPMLARVAERTARARRVDQVVVATTRDRADEAIVAFCRERGIAAFRGSEADVLDRYYQAACAHRAGAVVRITSDCPLIDPGLIDEVIDAFHRLRNYDYVSCILPPRTFPRGLDAEVISLAGLERSWRAARDPSAREHVTRYIMTHRERFKVRGLFAETDLSQVRWTVDEPEDLQLVERIYRHFGHDRFGWRQVLAAFRRHPEWERINAHIEQKAA